MDAALTKLERRGNLTAAEMTSAMGAIMTGRASDAAIERFLILLRDKGETAVEIAAAARVLREHSVKLKKSHPNLVDTCGTGGDGSSTLNVSTLSAIAVSAVGIQVAKHGNRSVSSVSGSADILEALGVPADADPDVVERCLERTGFGFFFAPRFHPAIRYAMPARKKIKGKTLFNLLGPLANPAGAKRQVVGVYSAALTVTIAEALKELGSERALVVHGSGMDEISLCAATTVTELKDGVVRTYEVKPSDFGLDPVPVSALQCATPEEAKRAAIGVLEGKKGPAFSIVALNAGAAVYLAGKADSIRAGAERAADALERGEGMKKLEEIKRAMK